MRQKKRIKKLFLSFVNFGTIFLIQMKEIKAIALDQGEQLFLQHCNVCHIGGKNVIIPEKNLQKRTLEITGMNTVDAIRYQITNGKNGMPAFGGRLEEKEIEKIAIYVLDQSNKTFVNQ